MDAPGLPSFQFTAARRKDCTRTFGLSMRDELAVPDGFCWSAPNRLHALEVPRPARAVPTTVWPIVPSTCWLP